MSIENNGAIDELTSSLQNSQINLSEAGPDIVQVEGKDEVFKHPNSLEFLEGLKITPTGRDFSKESLYTKFDPLISPKKDTPNKNPAIEVLDKLISLTPSPHKQPVNIVTPLKKETNMTADSTKNDITKLTNLEHTMLESELSKLHELLMKQEKVSQEKMNEYENQVVKLTGQTCVLSDELKEAKEREKALAKKVNEQNQSQLQLNIVMQEYERLISKLTSEIENDKKTNSEKIIALTVEKESALTHLNNVEAAFSDVHEKYEKSKKVIEDYKKNEAKMKIIINEQLESIKIKDKQLDSLQACCNEQGSNAQKQLDHLKLIHDQEITRSRALFRKTELRVASLQESLDQKIKENQELAAIVDDLIAGKGAD